MEETESLGLKRPGHPPDSRDTAPTGFLPFGEVKRRPKGTFHTSVDDVEMAIRSFPDPVRAKMLKRVFEEWIARCRTLSVSDGNCLARE
jgi:hypothetical protein